MYSLSIIILPQIKRGGGVWVWGTTLNKSTQKKHTERGGGGAEGGGEREIDRETQRESFVCII